MTLFTRKGFSFQIFDWFSFSSVQFSSVQSLSRVQLSATPWIAPCQAFLSITNSQSSLKLTSIESVMPSSHLILCRPLFLLPPIPPSIRVFHWVNSSHEVAKVLEFQLSIIHLGLLFLFWLYNKLVRSLLIGIIHKFYLNLASKFRPSVNWLAFNILIFSQLPVTGAQL